MQRITSYVVKKLQLPKPNSHKGDNGRLLIIAGNEKYHGSLIYALKAASRIVDLIYVLTTAENQKLVRKLKSKTAEFIPAYWPINGRATSGSLPIHRLKIDCVLIGPGMGVSRRTYELVKAVLKSKTRAVLDADALNVMDKKLLKSLTRNHILTPHRGEFKRLIKVATSLPPSLLAGREEQAVDRFMRKYSCTVVLKGKVDIVGNPEQGIKYNFTGNQGMTKGGTGDVLAGLIAAFSCQNDAFVSAAAGVYLNGLAGDELYKKVGPFYNAEDLLEQIPKTLWEKISNF